ncbi:MAG: trypsin-like serine protease [Bdellovibrionota bacterium]|nr:trypsin-like serine protease [Bdellovibrionota bacterium]
MGKVLFILSAVFLVNSALANDSELEIIGGTKVEDSEHPYVLALDGCTGFVVHKNLIATAAHCIQKHGIDPKSSYVSVGNSYHGDRKRDLMVKKIHVHPWYKNKSVYDIAFIEVNVDLQIKYHISEIPSFFIGQESEYLYLESLHPQVLAVGYGRSEKSRRQLKRKVFLDLKAFYFDIKSKKSESMGRWSKSLAKKHSLMPSVVVHSWLIRDTCKGDSGGPQMLKVDGRYQYLSLTMGGGNVCGKGADPGVYRLIYPSICEFPELIGKYFKEKIGKKCESIKYRIEL